MSFLYPSFLLGLFAIAIPIVLHLIQLRRAKRVVFSNVKIIRVSKDLTASQRTLKDILVLLARILFLTFFVLAFAQPFISKSKSAGFIKDSRVDIVVDNSFSAQNFVKGKDYSILSATNDLVGSVVDLFPSNTLFNLFTNGGSTSGYSLQNFEATDYVNNIGFVSSSFPRIATSNNPSHLFLFSDFQKSTFKVSHLNSLDESTQVHLMPIEYGIERNISIDSVYLEDEFLRSGSDNMLFVRVSNTSSEDVSGIPLKLFIKDNLISTISLDLPAKQSIVTKLAFKYTGDNSNQKGYVQIEDYPVDFDNTYYFVLSPSSKINIVELHDGGDTSLEKLFEGEPFFEMRSSDVGSLNYNELQEAEFVILNSLNSVPSGVSVAISNFINAGGTLLILPPASNNSSYNTFFRDLGIPANLRDVDNLKTKLVAPDQNHPFYKSIFDDYNKQMEMPVSTRNLFWSRASDDLLKFKGGAPFLSRFDRGDGQVFLMASPLQEEHNALVNHALLLPIMYKMAISGYKKNQQLGYSLSDPSIQLSVNAKNTKDGVFGLKRDSLTFIPEQQLKGGKLYFNIPPDMNEAGFYTLTHQGEVILSLAFNYNKVESQLEQYTYGELKSLFKDNQNIHVYEAGDAISLKGEFEKRYFGVKLWKYCLILCLFFLMAEIALIRFL